MAQKRKGAKGAKNAHRHIQTEKYLLPYSWHFSSSRIKTENIRSQL